MTKNRKSSLVRVLLETNEYNNHGIGDISYALITLSVTDIRKLIKLMDEVNHREDIDYIATFDCSPYWLSSCEDTIRDGMRGGDIEDFSRMECEIREVNDHRVYWRALYKHTECEVETRGLYREHLEDLMRLAKGEISIDDPVFVERNGDILNLEFLRGLETSTT